MAVPDDWVDVSQIETTSATGPPELEDVYREHRLALLRLAYLLIGSREQAEDIVQSAFVTGLRHWDRIQQPLPYLKRAVVNLANDTHRRRFRDHFRLPQFITAHPPDAVTAIPEVDEAWAHVRRLPVVQRTVIVLHYYEDLSLVEISRMMSRPAATVRSDLRRALDRLRKELS